MSATAVASEAPREDPSLAVNQKVVGHGNAQGHDQTEIVGVQFGAGVTLVNGLFVGEEEINGVNARYKRAEYVSLHQAHLRAQVGCEFPNQPDHHKQLNVRKCFDQSSFGIKAPQVTKSRENDEEAHDDVAERRAPNFSPFENGDSA